MIEGGWGWWYQCVTTCCWSADVAAADDDNWLVMISMWNWYCVVMMISMWCHLILICCRLIMISMTIMEMIMMMISMITVELGRWSQYVATCYWSAAGSSSFWGSASFRAKPSLPYIFPILSSLYHLLLRHQSLHLLYISFLHCPVQSHHSISSCAVQILFYILS